MAVAKSKKVTPKSKMSKPSKSKPKAGSLKNSKSDDPEENEPATADNTGAAEDIDSDDLADDDFDEDEEVIKPKTGSKDVLAALVKRGKEQGYLTFDDIQDRMDSLASDRKVMAKLMAELEKAKVDLLEEPPGKAKATKKKASKKSDEDLQRSTDPVRMYLRKMGTVPLLTREGEVEIAKRIEQGEDAILEVALQAPITLTDILKLGEELAEKRLKARDIVRDSDEDEDTYDEAEVDRRVTRQFDKVRRLQKEDHKCRRIGS